MRSAVFLGFYPHKTAPRRSCGCHRRECNPALQPHAMQTLLRHLLTALGGALLIDTSNTQALIGGLVCIGCTVLWSHMSKVSSFTDHYHISDDKVTLLKKLVCRARLPKASRPCPAG